jgi:hypothetical protein
MVRVKVYQLENNNTFDLNNSATWGDFVEKYLKQKQNGDCTVNFKGKYVGIDIPLTDTITKYQDENEDIILVSSEFSSAPYYYRIKYAYNAFKKSLKWPLWNVNAICPLNKLPLGSVKDMNVPLNKNNRPENLIVLDYGTFKKVVNKYCYHETVTKNNSIDPFVNKKLTQNVIDSINVDTYSDFNDLTVIKLEDGNFTSLDKSYSCEDFEAMFD